MNVLVTGGAGFIGSNYVRMLLQKQDDRVINLDLLTYAGNLENLAGFESHPGYRFVRGDIRDGDYEVWSWALIGMTVFLGMRFADWDEERPAADIAAAASELVSRGMAKSR